MYIKGMMRHYVCVVTSLHNSALPVMCNTQFEKGNSEMRIMPKNQVRVGTLYFKYFNNL